MCKDTREARACLQVGKQGRAKAEREDLEVGAVDELLVGECEVERVRQGTKNTTLLVPFGLSLSPLYY